MFNPAGFEPVGTNFRSTISVRNQYPMLAVFELLLAWYRFGFLGRSPTPLASQPGSSCQSFLSISAVVWFPESSWPKVQNALAPISDLYPFVFADLLGLGTQCSS